MSDAIRKFQQQRSNILQKLDIPQKSEKTNANHIILIPDKMLQVLPWESIFSCSIIMFPEG